MTTPSTTPGALDRARTWIAATLAGVVALTGVSAAVTPSADAGVPGRKCISKKTGSILEQKTVREFDTSGFNTDVDLELCIMYDHSERGYWAAATGHFTDGGGVRKFDRFDLKIGVQRNDKTVLSRTYGHAREINESDPGSGSINDWARYYHVSDQGKGGAWTADAVVTYDLDADGEGPKEWHLPGTPPIR